MPGQRVPVNGNSRPNIFNLKFEISDLRFLARNFNVKDPIFGQIFYPCLSVCIRGSMPFFALLSGKYQKRVAGRACSKEVAGTDEQHAAGDGRAGSGHRAALGRDVINCFITTDHVVLPK